MAYVLGSLVHVYYASGAGTAMTNEPMEEVNLTPIYPRYTVYRITADAKQILHDTPAPTFEADVAGNSVFAAITPSQIWYGAGYIVLSVARGATDVVQCNSGNYLTAVEIFACATRDLEKTLGEADVTVYSDTAIKRTWTIKDWNATFDILYASVNATATSSGGAANSHITAEHVTGGTAGNGKTFDLQDNDDAAITISVVGNDIVVGLATVAGTPVSTASQVVAALNADPSVDALGIQFRVKAGETGAGVVADSGPYTLTGGLAPIDFHSVHDGTRLAFRIFSDTSNNIVDAGFGFITSYQYTGGPSDVLKGVMQVSGMQYPMYQVTT